MRKFNFLFLILFLIFFIFWSGCITTRDFDLLKEQVDKNTTLIYAQQKQLKEKIDALNKRLSLLEKRVKKETFPLRTAQADLWSNLENIRREVAEVKNQYQVLEYRIQESLKNRLNPIQQKLEENSKQLQTLTEEILKIKKEFSIDQIGIKKKSSKNKVIFAKTNATSIYKKAMNLFKSKKYEQAIKVWELFIKKYPKHYLIANSYFWQGECYYRLKKYPYAILKYQMVIENYPRSNKYRACLLKQGISFYKINKKKAGRIILQKLIKEFPKSVEAKKARMFLKDIKRGQKG